MTTISKKSQPQIDVFFAEFQELIDQMNVEAMQKTNDDVGRAFNSVFALILKRKVDKLNQHFMDHATQVSKPTNVESRQKDKRSKKVSLVQKIRGFVLTNISYTCH